MPLLLAKLWAVYPKLWQWPPFRFVGHAVERLLCSLVAGALFQLVTGALNIAYVYPWPFGFPGALLDGLRRLRRAPSPRGQRVGQGQAEPVDPRREPRTQAPAVHRRRGLWSTPLVTAGEAVTPLARLAVLAPRDPRVGSQGAPVNRSAAAAGVRCHPRLPAAGHGRRPHTPVARLRRPAEAAAAHRTPADRVRGGLERGVRVDRRTAARPARGPPARAPDGFVVSPWNRPGYTGPARSAHLTGAIR